MQTRISLLEHEIDAGKSREHQQQLYARTVWGLCEAFRSTITYNNSDYTTKVLQILAKWCDDIGVPTGRSSELDQIQSRHPARTWRQSAAA